MFIIVKFNSNDNIVASTELDGKKVSIRTSVDYKYGASINADIAAEKLINKAKEFGMADIEFARESSAGGYIYISLTQMTDKAVLTSNWG